MTGKQQLPVPIRNTPLGGAAGSQDEIHKNSPPIKILCWPKKLQFILSSYLFNRSHIYMPDISLGKHERKV